MVYEVFFMNSEGLPFYSRTCKNESEIRAAVKVGGCIAKSFNIMRIPRVMAVEFHSQLASGNCR